LSLADLNNPVELAFYPELVTDAEGNEKLRLDVKDDVIYLLNQDNTLTIYDAADLENVQAVLTLDEGLLRDHEDGPVGTLRDVAAAGDQLFVLTQGGTAVYDISNPLQPQPLRRDLHTIDHGRLYTHGVDFLTTFGDEIVTNVQVLLIEAPVGRQIWSERLSASFQLQSAAADGQLVALVADGGGLILLTPANEE